MRRAAWLTRGAVVIVVLGALVVDRPVHAETASAPTREETPAERPARLEPVVVTPGRIQQRAGDVPASVTVLGSEDVRRSPSQTVDDLLRQIPSFSLFRRSSSLVTHPTAQGVSLRGIGPSGASRALVLVDGVPINDPFGGWVPWSRIPMLSIDQIEVVRGGGSAVWGNGAVGGVINVITRRPEGRSAAFEGSYGSYDTTNLDLYLSEVRGPFRLGLEGNWFETGGFNTVLRSRRGPIDIDADSTHGVGNARLDFVPTPDLTLFISGTYFQEDRQNGTALQVNDTVSYSLAGGATLRTPDGSEWQGSVYWQHQRFHSTFSTQALDRASETLALNQHSPALLIGGALSWSRLFGAHRLLAGLDGRWIQGETDEEVFNAGTFARVRVAGGEEVVGGAFVQDVIALSPAWDLVLGIRTDYYTSFDGRRHDTPPPAGVPPRQQFADRDFVIPSPRVATLIRVTPATDVEASAYQGFRVPTLNELYRPFRVRNDVTVANARLSPERLTGGEAGVRQRLGDLGPLGAVDARVTGFWNQVKDQVLNVTLASRLPDCPAGTTCRQRQNVDVTRIRGVEAELELRPFRNLRFVASHAFTDTEVLDAPTQRALEGKRLAQVPANVTTLALRWDWPEWVDVDVIMRLVGRQYEDDLNTLPLGRYTLLDVKLSHQVTRWGSAYFAVENVTNEVYAVARTSEGVVSVGSPRLVHGGVRLAF